MLRMSDKLKFIMSFFLLFTLANVGFIFETPKNYLKKNEINY